jgi:hypothetical protein
MVCVALFQLASCSPRSSPSSCCCCNFSLSSSSSTHSSISFPLHVSNFDRPCSSAPTSLWPRLSSISSTRAHRGVGGGGGGGGGRGRKELRVSRLEFTTRCLGGDQNDSGDNKPETLFMRELRKRGIMPTSTTDDGNDSGTLGTGTKTKEGENDKSASGSSGTGPFGTSTKSPPKQTDEREKSNQRERSMALNSEGIDGLIPRGLELLKLGGSFWLPFWPLIVATVSTFVACYLVCYRDFPRMLFLCELCRISLRLHQL